MNNFGNIQLDEKILLALKKLNITQPTLVQSKSIPVIRQNHDVLMKSPTGTGKTLAFLLPLFEKIDREKNRTQILILSPTRELTLQIAHVAKSLEQTFDVRSMAVLGGQDIFQQKEQAGKKIPHMVIATVGRLLDFLEGRVIRLEGVQSVVIDEADEMLKLGFIEDVEKILLSIHSKHQIILCSATFPERIKQLAKRFLHQPKEIFIEDQNENIHAKKILNIRQRVLKVQDDEEKISWLIKMIAREQPYLMMVFCSTKARVDWLTLELAKKKILVDGLHGDLTQSQRAFVLKKFRQAKTQVLVTTDIAARGLDIEGVTHVVNFDLPNAAQEYTHRIGRTGRAGNDGEAITFLLNNERAKDLDTWHKILKARKNLQEPKKPVRPKKFKRK